MKHNTNKEKWIDEVLGSTHGISRAQPGTGLYEQVQARLRNPRQINSTPFPVKQWVAAAILLLALNVGSVVYLTGTNKKASITSTENPLAVEMQSLTSYNY